MKLVEGIHLNPQQVIEHLAQNGYFRRLPPGDVAKLDPEAPEVTDALGEYQGFHGLLPDKVFGPKTEARILAPRCALPDFAFDESDLPRWPETCRRVTTCHRLGALNPLPTEREHALWLAGLAEISAHAEFELLYIDSMQEANIHASPGRMGRGTLAWSYLPNGRCGERLEQQYNSAVNWSEDLYLDTLVHELLHACGLGHGPAGSIMQATAGENFHGKLQAWDIAELQKRYGKKKPTTPPPTVPVPTDSMSIVAEYKGSKFGGVLARL